MTELLPLFLNLSGRSVVLVGGGRVAAGKLRQLLAAGASVTVVAPEIRDEIADLVGRPLQGRLDGEPERLALHVGRPFQGRRGPERPALRLITGGCRSQS